MRPECVGEAGDEERARRRRQLDRGAVLVDRNALGQARRRRRRHRERAVRAADGAAAQVQRRGDDAIGAEPLEREDAADDVHDRVERAHFVQVDVFDRHLVDVGLDGREAADQRDGAIARRRRERRPGDQPLDPGDVPVRMVLRGATVLVAAFALVSMDLPVLRRRHRAGRDPLVEHPPRRRDAGPQHARRRDVVVVEAEAAEGRAHGVQRDAGVEAGAEQHVARDAGEAIEIEEFRHGSTAVTDRRRRARPTRENCSSDGRPGSGDRSPRSPSPPRRARGAR